ncbi:MAG: class I mannose-6-phosphate isomerase [Prevotella sp.]
MRKPNYDKEPSTLLQGDVFVGWENIVRKLSKALENSRIWVLELYSGVYEDQVEQAFAATGRKIVRTRDLFKSEDEIHNLTQRFMTDDSLFGYISNVRLDEYFDPSKTGKLSFEGDCEYIVIGTGASMIAPKDAPVIYFDMARWEIQQRFRRHEVKAIGIDNSSESPSLQYKRGYFNDWNICDRLKTCLNKEERIVYWIDTNKADRPKMISNKTFMEGISKTTHQPFRVVPFFDPAPWGGQWMKEVCDLNRSAVNYGWCFDCVPEENSLFFKIDGELFELPSQDLVLFETRELLGEAVESRFGKSFPIRFDFLDTMDGGNLSLQVHPTTQFVHDNFGIHYTQDESYYLVDAAPDAVVYIGLKENVAKTQMLADLRRAQREGTSFDVEKYVNKIPTKKHDHFLIPNGTIHCSGRDSMVLEISSTPNLFTFKLYDWQRLGLDGKPRPINIDRGEEVIAWERDTNYVQTKLHNHFETISKNEDVVEERTGLHPNEFIETHRTSFSTAVTHETRGSVNVLNLVEGEEVEVSSPTHDFEPLIVHYAETFIIPASVKQYIIKPHGLSEGKRCMTIKASVRI